MLSFGSYRVLDCLFVPSERLFKLLVQSRRERTEGADALQQTRDERVMSRLRGHGRTAARGASATIRSAATRCARTAASSSPLARKWSSKASFSALGHAQSSPMVSGVTDWNALMKR